MKATHTDYMHPKHLRVEGCKGYAGSSVDVLCVAPNSDLYKRMYRPGLPSYRD
jgi:hypothetical protein